MVTQGADFPPIAYHEYPIAILIHILRYKARYQARIFALEDQRLVPIEISPHTLAELNEQLQNEMQAVADRSAEGELTSTEPEEQLRPLAEMGNYAFKQVFGHERALACIQELLGMSTNISIQIVSQDFFLPWELLYPASLDDPLSCQHFWGMNYVISRTIERDDRREAFVPPIIPVTGRPKVGLLAYCALPAVKEEVVFFENLRRKGVITLRRLRALNPEKEQEEFKVFKAFWEKTFHLAHFACHAFYRYPRNQSCIVLSNDFPITLAKLDVYDVNIKGHPLVVLNACQTGNLNPLYTVSFVEAFLKHGALGVVATECAVPDAFAADFAQQLYTHLLAGEPLGESLLAARRYFLEEYHNPTGLLYSMYAPPSIRLAYTGG